jgi:hypothetical protein
MLVDESGSETAAKVADERQSAGTIAQAMLNPRSRVTVVGFGGVNNNDVAPYQNPVNVVCRPTIASGAVNLSYLASCVNGLHRRSEAEGDDTDYNAALGQAMSYFDPATAYGRQSPPGAIKVILMMTDGGVDVHRDTKQYGTDWLSGVKHDVDLQLATARADDVQVWPLGFGVDIQPADTQYLDYIAAHGAQTSCDNRSVSRPRAQIVQDPSNALRALDTLYAAAACLGSSSASGSLGGNTLNRTLYVNIPAIASDAVISVDRGNANVAVNFKQPGGAAWADPSAISGTGTPIEVLHVTDPRPGQWQIQLTAPPGMASELVSATVFWQGAVDAEITATPSSVQPGQPVSVTLSVLTPKGPVTDPATLSQMQVAVSVSGDGLSGPTEVPVSNNGEQGTNTGVGDYKGTFTAPRAQGTLTFTGTAAGYGLYATKLPATVQVGGAVPGLQVAIQPPVTDSVQAGRGIGGELKFTNPGAARTVRLSLSVSHAFATIASPAGEITVPSGSPPSMPFTIHFAGDSPTGPAWLQVKVVDASNGTVYNAATVEVTVTKPKGIVGQYLWAFIGGPILLILVGLLLWLRRRARRRASYVSGLFAIIRRDGERVAELKAPGKRSDTFRFVIRDAGQATAWLDYPRPDDEPYTARRGRTGQVKVVAPTGVEYDITVGGVGEPLPGGLQLAFRDARRAGRPRAAANGNGTSTRPPVDSGDTVPSSDPWLT